MVLNPDITKQAQEVIFSRNSEAFSSSNLLNDVTVEFSVCQKHLGSHLDQKLDFSKHINEKSLKHKKKYQSLKNFIIF